jgi:ABC-type glycerol-3-phosphate transport system permease component
MGSALRHTLLLLGAAVMLAPFVLMVSISLKPPGTRSRTTPPPSPACRWRASC